MNQVEESAAIPIPEEPRSLPLNPFTAKEALHLCIVGVLIWHGSPGLSILAGMLLALAVGQPHRHTARISKALFQSCVVLLGFGTDFAKMLSTGTSGFLFAAVSIASTLGLGFLLGHFLGVGKRTSALISSGTAICGGSAIAAVGPVIFASEAEMGIAIGAIFLLNAAALFLFPALGAAFHLSQHQFGIWAGIGIHDISSVVGAASAYGREALQTATAVKLSRALWIVPLTLGMGAVLAKRPAHRIATDHPRCDAPPKRKTAIPYFIGFFLLASILRSLVPAVAHHAGGVETVAKAGMCAALYLVGASISPETLRTLGWKVALQATLLWLFISSLAFGLAVTLG